MSKITQHTSLLHRIGYGPLLVPPLAIVLVFCFGFMMAESHIVTSRSQAAARKSRIESSNHTNYHAIKSADLNTLPKLETENSVAPTGSASGATPQTPGVSSSDLQSAKPNNQDATNKVRVPSPVHSTVENVTRTAENLLND